MPDVPENWKAWQHYDWARRGDEWSHVWGGTEGLWWGTLFPRIRSFVPAGTILEIAPGFGRCTQYLKDLCRELVVVDLAARCIEACRQRFVDESHIRYHVNDGRSLAAIPEASIDFAFSYDSLVHAESDVVGAYLQQLARKLRPEGAGFFHHSNLGSFRDPRSGAVRVENVHWRAESMSAALFAELCATAGLRCVSQEVVNWGGELLTDCFSTFAREGSPHARRPHRVVENPGFMDEAARVARLVDLYAPGSDEPGPDAPRLRSVTRLLQSLRLRLPQPQ